ncbi:MAG: transcriptional regulator NanR [Alphaproteobacteria bacterium]|nr:transcriptional regulator NanR [Alphaproteobacteria bacterium]
MDGTEIITRRKLSQEVLDRLIAAIQSNEFPPGAKLPSERDLMARFGVGRPAIREAVQALNQMGLARIAHGERSRIILPTPNGVIDQISAAMVQLLAVNPRGLDDLKQARVMCEVGLARIAATEPTPAGLERLRVTLAASEAAIGKREAFVAADMAFHEAIAEMSGNALIAAFSAGMLAWLTRFRRGMVSVRGADRLTISEHQRIYSAIAAGKPDDAAQAMTEHLTRANALYAALTRRGPDADAELGPRRPPRTRRQ